LAIAYLVVEDHFRTAQTQLATLGYHTDNGEGLPDDERIAITRAKRWVEENLMANNVSLDARYQVRKRNGAYKVHVVFVTGNSPTGSLLYVPKGHCVIGLSSMLKESETFMPRGFEPLLEQIVNGRGDGHSTFAHLHAGRQAAHPRPLFPKRGEGSQNH
jgi:hypothetical protein